MHDGCQEEFRKDWLRKVVRAIDPKILTDDICNETLWLGDVDNPIRGMEYDILDPEQRDRLHAKSDSEPFDWKQWTIE